MGKLTAGSGLEGPMLSQGFSFVAGQKMHNQRDHTRQKRTLGCVSGDTDALRIYQLGRYSRLQVSLTSPPPNNRVISAWSYPSADNTVRVDAPYFSAGARA